MEQLTATKQKVSSAFVNALENGRVKQLAMLFSLISIIELTQLESMMRPLNRQLKRIQSNKTGDAPDKLAAYLENNVSDHEGFKKCLAYRKCLILIYLITTLKQLSRS